ncbi:MAG: repeat-associated core domain protein [Flaviaesturariibacter sp.]|nr:repeat-associated core domain protein [Flaviaesturariibacter sp.]
MKRLFKYLVLVVLLLGVTHVSKAQLSISGPTCVDAGLTYQYTASGAVAGTRTWCITNGTFVGISGSCVSAVKNLTSVEVVWSGTATSGTLSFSNGGFTTTITVTMTQPLDGGAISQGQGQTITYNTTPGTIQCSPYSGGECGSTFSYLWQQSSDNINWSYVSGETSQNLSFSAPITQSTYYRRRVQEANSTYQANAYSNSILVTVMPQLAGGMLSPASQTIAHGNVPQAMTSSSSLSGNCNGSYTYQWESSPDGTTFTAISGATALSYTPGSLTATTHYRRKVFCGSEQAYSNAVIVTVMPALVGGTISPASQTITYGTVPQTITPTGSLQGNCGSNYAYQWESSLDGTTFTAISGAASLAYTPGALTVTTHYRRKVTCASEQAYSNTVLITVMPALSGGTLLPATQTITYGAIPQEMTASGSLNGNCGGNYSYQWESSSDGSNFTAISGAAAPSFTPGALTATTYYRRKVTCGSEQAYSGVATITVMPQLVSGVLSPASQSITYNTVPQTLGSSGNTGGNCSSNYSYQWESSADGSNFTTIGGAVGASYSPAALTSTTHFRRKITCGTEVAYSATVVVSVMPALTGGSLSPSAQTITYNTAPQSMSSAGGLNGNCGGGYSYQWESSLNGTSFSPISGATGLFYAPGALTANTHFRRMVTCGTEQAYSNSVLVTVAPQLTGGTISPSSQSVSPGGTSQTLSSGGGLGGNCGSSYSYQWESSGNGTNFSAIPGATSASFTPSSLSGTTYFRRFVTCGSEQAYSNNSIVNYAAPALTPGSFSVSSITIALGDTITLLSPGAASGGNCSGAYQYSWQYSYDNSDFEDVFEATGASLLWGSTIEKDIYIRRKVLCGTDSAYTSVFSILIAPPLSAGVITTASQTVQQGFVPSAIQATAASQCSSSIVYEWQVSNDGYSYAILQGATGQNLTYSSALTQNTYFRRKASCGDEKKFTRPLLFSVQMPAPDTTYVPTSLDVVLDSVGINIHTLFQIPNDSIANNRTPRDTAWFHLDDQTSLTHSLNQLEVQQLDINASQLADSAQKLDSVDLLLIKFSAGGAGSDSAIAPATFMDDNLVQLYRSSGNFAALDSIISSEPKVSFEEIAAVLNETLPSNSPFKRVNAVSYVDSLVQPEQSYIIQGEPIVNRTGTFRYSFTGSGLSNSGVFWVVKGGNILAQNANPATGLVYADVQWVSSFDVPYIALLDLSSARFGITSVVFNLKPCFILPAVQNVAIGQVPQSLTASTCTNVTGTTTTYQWQVLSVYGNGSWTDISGATQGTYQPPALNNVWLMYRRITKVYNSLGSLLGMNASSAASVLVKPIVNRVATTSNYVPRGSSPSVSSDIPSGGLIGLSGTTTTYTWQVSYDGSNWWSINGSSATFPGYTILQNNTKIRRWVQVTGGPTNGISETLWSTYSNVLEFTTQYQTADYENRNYIREHVVLTRGVDTWEAADVLAIDKKAQTTTYLDGLSRPVQKVGKGTHYNEQTGQWWDMVQNIDYQAGGQVTKSLLPYPSTENLGKFKSNAATDQIAYYTSNFSDVNAFAKVEYDGSPLNRVKKAFSPGDSWGGSNKGVAGDVEPYTTSEGVKRLTIGFNAGDLPQVKPAYPSLWLTKYVGKDEKDKRVITYTDKSGQVILKKVQLADDVNLTPTQGWLSTYYVYDDLGQLRVTITPKAVTELNAANWVISSQIIEDLCFTYQYDELGRTVAKKTPGKAIEYFVYDKRDRLVLSQDGNGRGKTIPEWHATLYDEYNRIVATGLYKTTKTLALLKADAEVGTWASINEGWVQINNSPIDYNAINNPNSFTPLGFSYYDNKYFQEMRTFVSTELSYKGGDVEDHTIITQRVMGMATGSKVRVMKDGTPQYLSSTVFYDEEGRVVQTQGDNIAGGVDISSTQYHFDGRVLSNLETHNNPLSPYTTVPILTKYKFDKTGRVKGLLKKIASDGRSYTSTTENGATDEDEDAGYKSIASYSYNELGRRTKKVLSPLFNNGLGLETLNYDYNIRGWLTGINKGYVLGEAGSNQWSHYFGLYLGYDNKNNEWAAAQLNGQITGLQWRSQGDNIRRKYEFQYDNANRLKQANFSQEVEFEPNSFSNQVMDFSVKDISYDDNGNLLSMKQMGILPGAATPVLIDNLSYQYAVKSNRLLKVTDAGALGAENGKLGDFKKGNTTTDNDYSYDTNGNIVVDKNRGIASIVYNYLDKPEQINLTRTVGTATVTNTIKYIYAGGTKVQKVITDNSAVPGGGVVRITTTSYIGAFVYEQVTTGANAAAETLQSIAHEEGRIRIITPHNIDPANVLTGGGFLNLPDGKEGVYDYFIKDHLGNVRTTITEEINKASMVLTMETTNTAIKQQEEAVFGNPAPNNEVVATRVAKSDAAGWNSNTSAEVSKLVSTSGSAKVGPNVILRVMAGDKVSATSKYYYSANPGSSNGSTGLNGMLTSLMLALSGDKGGALAHGQSAQINTNLNSSVSLQNLYNSQPNSGVTAAPKSYLNYIFFDENFNFVSQNSGFHRVSQAGDGASALLMTEVKAPKNGYVYVYLSNESSTPVYFDDFSVSHNRSALIGEDHYYSFGLKIAAISSKAVATSLNAKLPTYGYQGAFSEEVSDFELNYNEFDLRTYDPQIGRWTGIDPYDEFASPYTGMGNDPISNVDPTGGFIGGALKGLFSGAVKGMGCWAPGAASAGISAGTSTLASVLSGAAASFSVAGAIQASGIYQSGAGLSEGVGGSNVTGGATNTTTAEGNNINTTESINQQLNDESGAKAGDLPDENTINGAPQEYWILYNGKQVITYKGTYGDVSKSVLIKIYGGTSGAPYKQNALFVDKVDEGPVPEGDYSVNLTFDFTRKTKVDPKTGDPIENRGVEVIPWGNGAYYSGWGLWRARLEKVNVNSTRDNFYFHDSYKGESHGCIETETELYYDFAKYKKLGQRSIKVKVDYPQNANGNAPTRGNTFRDPRPWEYRKRKDERGNFWPEPKPGAFPNRKRL